MLPPWEHRCAREQGIDCDCEQCDLSGLDAFRAELEAQRNPFIRVWSADRAPAEFRLFDDLDWVAEVPPGYADALIPWLEPGSGFGVCSVSDLAHPDQGLANLGWRLYLGTHA